MRAGEKEEVEIIRRAAFLMTAAQQYRLAFLIAENLGYSLKSDDPLSDLSREEGLT